MIFQYLYLYIYTNPWRAYSAFSVPAISIPILSLETLFFRASCTDSFDRDLQIYSWISKLNLARNLKQRSTRKGSSVKVINGYRGVRITLFVISYSPRSVQSQTCFVLMLQKRLFMVKSLRRASSRGVPIPQIDAGVQWSVFLIYHYRFLT